MIIYFLKVIFLIILVFVSGCTQITKVKTVDPQQEKARAMIDELTGITTLDEYSEGEVPFEMDIAEDSYNGERLLVTVSIVPKIEWLATELLVKLIALRQGDVVGERFACIPYTCQRVFNQPLPVLLTAGHRYTASFDIKGRGITDYTVDLLWGDDARDAIRSGERELLDLVYAPSITSKGMDIKQRCVRDKDGQICRTATYLKAQIVNNHTSKILTGVKMGIGFLWLKDGMSLPDKINPSVEEVAELRNLHIEPLKARTLKIHLKGGVPKRKGGRYHPVYRIIDYEFADAPVQHASK